MSEHDHKRITIISTGGTIEKSYCEVGGDLSNRDGILDSMISQLELPGIQVHHRAVLNKDSLDMTDEDRELIVNAVGEAVAESDGVLVVHGTDRLAETGERLHEEYGDVSPPVVLTGAMRPYELRRTDALQNLTESLMALRLLTSGIWCVMHNEALRFPGIRKDREQMRFVQV